MAVVETLSQLTEYLLRLPEKDEVTFSAILQRMFSSIEHLRGLGYSHKKIWKAMSDGGFKMSYSSYTNCYAKLRQKVRQGKIKIVDVPPSYGLYPRREIPPPPAAATVVNENGLDRLACRQREQSLFGRR